MNLLRKVKPAIRAAWRDAFPEAYLRRLIGSGAGIFTHMSPNERLYLFDEAMRVSRGAGRFLEVGSYLGASASVLAEAARRKGGGSGSVFCVDTWHNDAMGEGRRDTFDEFRENTARWQEYIVPLRGSSSDVPLPDNGLFDLIFIDGDHSYAGARRDIERFAPRVGPGKLLVLHDYSPRWPGVREAAGELLQTGGWFVRGLVGSLLSLERAADARRAASDDACPARCPESATASDGSDQPPLVSVVMGVRNGLTYLSQAIDSILSQTMQDFEFIIVDDGSTDGTCEFLRKLAGDEPRIVLVEQEHGGLARALNAGLSQARGKYIARMDADDISLPQRFERQAAYLDANADCVAVGGFIERIDPQGRPLAVEEYPTGHADIERALLALSRDRATMCHPLAMIRRDAVAAIGGYREDFGAAQDRDLWLRLLERGRLASLPLVLLKYRMHSASVTSSRAATQKAAAERAIRDAYARRGISLPDEKAAADVAAQSTADVREHWARLAISGGNYRTALRHAWGAVIRNPGSSRRWRILARAFKRSLHDGLCSQGPARQIPLESAAVPASGLTPSVPRH